MGEGEAAVGGSGFVVCGCRCLCPACIAPAANPLLWLSERRHGWVKTAPNLTKTTMLYQPYQRAVRTRLGVPACTTELRMQSLFQNHSRLCGSEISVWADHAHDCARCEESKPHPSLVGWSAHELRRPSGDSAVRQQERTDAQTDS